MDNEEIPPCPYHGNPNPYYISNPSGLMTQDPLLPNAQEILEDLRFASIRSPTPDRQGEVEAAKEPTKKEKKKYPLIKITLEQNAALIEEYKANWNHDWDRVTRDRVREEIAGRVGVTCRVVSRKFGEFHRKKKMGRL